MKKYYVKILLVFCITAFTVPGKIIITESTTKQLCFTFELEDLSISSKTANNQTFSHISFFGSNSEIVTKNGITIPSISLYTGIPQSGKITALCNSHQTRKINLAHPLPKSSNQDYIDNSSKRQFNNPWISDIKYTQFRNLRTAHIFLKPFLYNVRTKQLTILEKGSCTITFPPSRTLAIPKNNPSGDYYKMTKNLILNYPIAQSWIKPRKRKFPNKKTTIFPPANKKMLRFKIGDGNDNLNEATTNENGIIKISPSDVIPVFGSSIPIQSLTLLSSNKKELGLITPKFSEIPNGVVEIPLLKMDINGNGLFDNNDYILAYVSSLSGWFFDSSINDYNYYLNHFENNRYYWLSIGISGKNISHYSCQSIPTSIITTHENRIKYKQSNQLRYASGGHPKGSKEWIWDYITTSHDSFSMVMNLPNPNKIFPGTIQIILENYTTSYPFSVKLGNTIIANSTNKHSFTNWNDSILTIYLDLPKHAIQLKEIDFYYSQNLDMNNKKRMHIYSPSTSVSQIVQYRLSSIPPEKTYIFRIANNESTIQLINIINSGGTYNWTDTTRNGTQYFVCTESGLFDSTSFESYISGINTEYEIKELRTGINRSDYLIITSKFLETEAIRLARHKKESGKFLNPKVVLTEHIYREFSGGNQDPAAIRNFIMYAHNSSNWSEAPDYVLLLGKGHYDYKRYTKPNEQNIVPPCIIGSFCYEDFYSIIGAGEYVANTNVAPSLILGRATCVSLQDAINVVDKIIDMEGKDADFGAWRNRILLVSDDDTQGSGFDPIFPPHYSGNEDIEKNIKKERPSVEVKKVMLFEYEYNEVFHKPEASRALINEINSGVASVNYFGHGSENAWADEAILIKNQVGNFNNYKQYPIINSFSCSVGYFDKPDHTSLSGKLVNAAKSGAIAAIGGTRSTSAGFNTEVSKCFFRLMFDKKQNNTLGQAYSISKSLCNNSNTKRYAFFGDPSIRFFSLSDTIEITLSNTSGNFYSDTLKALQKITINGRIHKNNTTSTYFGTPEKPAYVHVALFNPDQDSVHRKDGGLFSDPVYSLPGTPVFISVTEVKEGIFKQEILIPRKVPFNKPGVTIKTFASNGNDFATGFDNRFVFSGSDNFVPNLNGPQILIRPIYDNDSTWNTQLSFTDKISSFLPLEFEVQIFDENGMDLTGTGPDEGFCLEIPGVIKKQNLNNKLIFNAGEFTHGSATILFEANEILPGTYDMIICAQDLFGNISKETFTLEILTEDNFKLGRVFSYPNPVHMREQVKFFFYQPNTSEFWHGKVESTIKIYTLSGKLIRIFKNAKNGTVWNLTDQHGNKLTPNIYLYRITAKMINTGFSGKQRVVNSSIKKIVIYPPR